ncbi:hypothetical protein QFC19_005767 [Naganishia cerealis]|uniref:Uncharacterized protein n=1 Tax=Naganishia cerealis TaxID=610337 RepID=A0ACC2VLB8_9TREE|nr:hypothetical protein QFC19_005767 [Naganishia cerealis]
MSVIKTLALGTKQHVWDYQEDRDYENLKETWKACEELGLSFFDTAEIYGKGESERIIGRLLRDSSEEYRKKVVIATKYSPLGQGRLTGKYSAANPPPAGRRFSNMPMAELEPLLETMRGIAKKYDVPVSAVALNWVIAKGAIPLGGAKNRQQAEQNAKALTFTLTPEEVEELASKSFKGKT